MEPNTEFRTEPVAGRNLEGATLGEALGDDSVLLVFLRHLG
jgi:hypothetical protein